MARWRTRLRGSRAERGAAAVEFAIVLTLLLLILFGIIDFGRLLFVSQAVKSASREGARAAVVNSGTGKAIWDAAKSSGGSAASLAGGTMTVTVAPNTGSAVTAASTDIGNPNTNYCPTGSNNSVTVTVRVAPFRWFTPVGIFASSVKDAQSSTTMRCE